MVTTCPICRKDSDVPCACRDLRRAGAEARALSVASRRRGRERRKRAGEAPFRVVDVHISDDFDTATVALAGDMDLAAASGLDAALAAAIMTSSKRVVVNLSLVTFLDSTGISPLMRAHNVAAAAGRELHVERVPANVRGVMEVCDVWTTLAPPEQGMTADRC